MKTLSEVPSPYLGNEEHTRGWKLKDIVTHNHGGWEPRVKGEHTFKGFHVLWGEGDVEGLKISVQLLDFPPTNDWEDIRSFLNASQHSVTVTQA